MGKWLISISDSYITQFTSNFLIPQIFKKHNLFYDDEKDSFYNSEINTINDIDQIEGPYDPWIKNDIHLQRCSDYACFCNAKTSYTYDNPTKYNNNGLVWNTYKFEPDYPEQTILSNLWPHEKIPEDRIRYFVIHKKISAKGQDTETYKIVGNDETNKYIFADELNSLVNNRLIVNQEDLKKSLYSSKTMKKRIKII